jgi:hypothetical protein
VLLLPQIEAVEYDGSVARGVRETYPLVWFVEPGIGPLISVATSRLIRVMALRE